MIVLNVSGRENSYMEKWMHQGTTYCYDDLIQDIILCRKFGFDGIELKYNKIRELNNLDMIKRYLKKYHVKVGGIGSLKLSCLLNKNEDKENFLNMCNTAKELECNSITVNPYKGLEILNINKELIEEVQEENLIQYSDICKKYDISLVIEPLASKDCIISDYENCFKLVKKLELKNVKVCFDFWHYFTSRKDNYIPDDEDINNIGIIHVCDGIYDGRVRVNGENRKWLFEGVFALDKILNVILKKYEGAYSIEVYQDHKRWECVMEDCYKKGIESLNYLESKKKKYKYDEV